MSLLQQIVSVLKKPDRTSDDLELIREYVRGLEDFNNYIQRLSKSVVKQLLRSISVEEYPKNHIIFNKGDPSDRLFIVCSGSLDIADVALNGDFIPVSRLTRGKLIGERGLARRLPRSLSAIAHTSVVLMTVSSRDFRAILESSVLAQLDEKRLFLLKHLPCMDEYSKSQLERLAYVLELEVRHKGEVVVTANEAYDNICFVKEGTAAVVSESNFNRRVVIRLEEGSAIADECGFMNLKSKFSVIVLSDVAKFYKARRSDFMAHVSTATFQQLKLYCQYKLESHLLLKRKATERLPPLNFCSSLSSLNLASPQAQRNMQRICSFTRIKHNEDSINDTDYAKCKLQLELMRDCTSSRLKKFAPEASLIKRFKLRPSLPRDL